MYSWKRYAVVSDPAAVTAASTTSTPSYHTNDSHLVKRYHAKIVFSLSEELKLNVPQYNPMAELSEAHARVAIDEVKKLANVTDIEVIVRADLKSSNDEQAAKELRLLDANGEVVLSLRN